MCSYDRNIKGFMVQMGDPLGTGKGGTSIWNRKFEDEIVDNLKVRISRRKGDVDEYCQENFPFAVLKLHVCSCNRCYICIWDYKYSFRLTLTPMFVSTVYSQAFYSGGIQTHDLCNSRGEQCLTN